MKRIFCFFLILWAVSTLFADEMTQEEIAKCYKKSYDYETIGKYEKAITALKNVYLNYGSAYTVNYRLGWLYYLNKKYANSIDHFEKALVVYPTSIEVINSMILVHSAQLDWDKVEEKSVKVVKTDYYNFTANYWYSYSLRIQGKFDNAIIIDRKMLTVFPTSVTFLVELAENLYANSEFEECMTILYSVMVLDPDNAIAEAYLKKMPKHAIKKPEE